MMIEILVFALGIIIGKAFLEPLAKWLGQLIWREYSGAAFDILDKLLPSNLDRSLEDWEQSLTQIFMTDFALSERMAEKLASKTLNEAKLAPFIRKRNG